MIDTISKIAALIGAVLVIASLLGQDTAVYGLIFCAVSLALTYMPRTGDDTESAK